jgi:hypothetical protein
MKVSFELFRLRNPRWAVVPFVSGRSAGLLVVFGRRGFVTGAVW